METDYSKLSEKEFLELTRKEIEKLMPEVLEVRNE